MKPRIPDSRDGLDLSMLWMMSPLEIGDALTSMMGATTSAGDVFAVTATLEVPRRPLHANLGTRMSVRSRVEVIAWAGYAGHWSSLTFICASGSVEDDHRAKSIGLEPTTYGVSRFGCYQLTAHDWAIIFREWILWSANEMRGH